MSGFFAAEKEWKQFNVVFAPLKPRMSYQWWAWPGCFRYHAGPCLSELVVWSQAFYSPHIQMPSSSNSLKVEKICNIGQRKYLFAHHLSIDLTSFSLTCVMVIWWQLVICSFLGKPPLEKASVGLCPVVLHPSNTTAWRIDTNEYFGKLWSWVFGLRCSAN